MKNKYEEHTVIQALNRKPALKVDPNRKLIEELIGSSSNVVGIGSRGKIDFLLNFCGYKHAYVSKF